MAAQPENASVEARAAIVLGALVADAAAMGLHWLYDPERLAAIAETSDPAFLNAERENFDGTRGYFAHEGKRAGDLSQYGAVLALAMDSLVSSEAQPDIADYQRRYLAFFGPGGEWQGYIDRPTRGALANLGAGGSEDPPEVTGIDDDQLPAIAPVPAVVAADPEHPDLEMRVSSMVRVTNDNPLAVEAACMIARLIRSTLQGAELSAALDAEPARVGDVLQPLLNEALGEADQSSVDIAGHFGRACHVQQGLPVVFHILNTTDSFEDAVRKNILAGGDSCGRAMALGSILGAHFGFGGERGIPLPWLARLSDGARLVDQAYILGASN